MYPNRKQLLDSIQPGMKLDRLFFLKVYGYEISFPGFADEAIKALEDAGCSKAREYYEMAVGEYQAKQDEELKRAAAWYRGECEKEWKKNQKEGEERRKQEIQSLTREELTELCQTLLKERIITSPEQFAMAVLPDP